MKRFEWQKSPNGAKKDSDRKAMEVQQNNIQVINEREIGQKRNFCTNVSDSPKNKEVHTMS